MIATPTRRLGALATMAVLSTIAVLLSAPSGASANAPIIDFVAEPSTAQAGGHPDVRNFIWTESTTTLPPPEPSCLCHDTKEITFDLPPGLIGLPQNLPQCRANEFSASQCPIDSQVGTAVIGIEFMTPANPGVKPIPVYNLVPHPNEAGLLAFLAPFVNSPIFISFEPRTEGDFGATATIKAITHVRVLSYADTTFWGVPADPVHDPMRFGPPGCDSQGTGNAEIPCKGGVASNAPLVPLISNPTSCGVPLTATAEVLAYDRGTDHAEYPWPPTTGCDQLSFNPSLYAQPTTAQTDSPSGIDVDISVPQNLSPVAPTSSSIRSSRVTLPEGFSINPNAPDGKTSCSDADVHLDERHAAAQCPEFSKIGSLTIDSPALPGPLPGYIYLGDPKPGDRYRIWLIADAFGIHSKLPGSISADSQTGRLTTTFNDLPQFPIEDFKLHYFGSERGLIGTPERCGTYSVDSTFVPWNDALPDQGSSQFFSIDSGPGGSPCPTGPRPFAPGFEAGVSDKTAAARSPLTLALRRVDGDQNLTGLEVKTPPGFSAILKGIPYCPDAAIERLDDVAYGGVTEQLSSLCPVSSQVGTAIAGAGAGSRPVYVKGKVYLAGPYRGAPLSLVVVVPAVSGPYDLGNVVVRAAVKVDPITAQVTTVSDPLPQIREGVPLRTRFVRVDLDRPNFAINPTNCDPFSVDATIRGDEGASASRSSIFQITNCVDLLYGPKLTLRLTGGVNRRGHPAIHAVFKAAPGEANSRKVSVALPPGELLDNAHIGAICTRVAFAANACPEGSRIGTARVTTPLLDEPLTGAVYLRSSNNELPDIALDLKGQINFALAGRIDTTKGGALRTAFDSVPDVPVSSVVLNLAGGAKGLLINSKSLCGKPKAATVKLTGQNGVHRQTKVKLQTPCGRKAARR
jgi:hypothetical protein